MQDATLGKRLVWSATVTSNLIGRFLLAKNGTHGFVATYLAGAGPVKFVVVWSNGSTTYSETGELVGMRVFQSRSELNSALAERFSVVAVRECPAEMAVAA
jgi:hypothetical protein